MRVILALLAMFGLALGACADEPETVADAAVEASVEVDAEVPEPDAEAPEVDAAESEPDAEPAAD